MAKRRAMTSKAASKKKLDGHLHETHFAEAIGGAVNKGSQTDKKDVIDSKHRVHSVKGGEWWQLFLYGRTRFETNTAFRGIGNLADLMIDCIDAFPANRANYEADKVTAKIALQTPMRQLCAELNKPEMLAAFLDKAMFNGGEVNYLSVLPFGEYPLPTDKVFHIFGQSDVVSVLVENLDIANSYARNKKQMDAQKVVFRHDKNFGEIEVRTDSNLHYRQAKCRMNGPSITGLLKSSLDRKQLSPQIWAYGEAIRSMQWLSQKTIT